MMRSALLTFAAGAQALPEFRRTTTAGGCAPFTNGTFQIDEYQLYPENADFDTKRCRLYTRYDLPSQWGLAPSTR